ncbi:MAG: SDR family NAD(P)-dependent oxidoreductase [Coleofasciculus sp. G3-WIS-01]|uniref:SDR family NAD(P)-dependent oxidoreductase n=1 Tax=Coleofasciculus sp. G3-WIS-01 TaxID=3069528 RepID=UPI0032FF5392
MISSFNNPKIPVAQQTNQSLENDTDKQIAEYLQSLKTKVEKALLSNPLVDDCAVLIRETATCQPELVVYIVSTLPISPEQIQSQLQGIVSKALLPKAYVPVSTIPLTATGQVDEAALARLEVIDSDLINTIEEQLQSWSEIDRVAVVVEPLLKDISPLHLDDLLPDRQAMPAAVYANAPEDSQTQTQVTTLSEKIENKCSSEAKKLAISHGEPLHYPEDAPKTLGEVLQRAAQQSTKGIVYIQPDGTESVQSYQELWQEAQRILAGLKKLGLKPQDKVIFQLEHTQDFIPAFWGCVLGGFVPVPISIAPTYEQVNSTTSKLQNAWQMLGKPLVLAGASLTPKIRGLSSLLNLENFQVETIDKLRSCEPDFNWHSSQPEDLAILLLTSGSTGIPKSVMLNHRNLLSMSAGTVLMNNFSSQDTTLNWMPLDHVGALVFLSIMAVDLGCQQIHVPTDLILQNPLLWLDLIDCHKATISWAPNFAFNLICDRAEDINQKHWDLSSMRFLVNAGEAIVAKIARNFLQLLRRHGLQTNAIHPAFGMCETCSGITWSDSFSLESSSDDASFVELGLPIAGASLRIVDENEQIVTEGTIGRLQVKGASVTSGYYQNPQANQEVFTSDCWFNTGDLGFLRQGRLTITGRQKDVIIINGLNHYCHEIEAAVEEVEGVEVSYTAACAVRVTGSNTDKLAIFFNPKLPDDEGLVNLLKEIRDSVVNKVGLNPDYLIPVDKEIIPKTAIGKIQRSQLSQRFNAGEFKPILKRVDILLGNANTIPDWFYRIVWKPKCPVTFNFSEPLINPTLVFLDSFGLGAYLCQILSQHNQPYITVSSGQDFRQISRSRYTIAPGKAEHYRLLIESLAADNIIIGQILHLWTYDEYIEEVSSLEALEQAQEQGIYSLLFLVQALAKVQGSDHWVQLLFISSHIQSISSTDPIAYEKSSVLGLLKTIPQELPWLNCRHIDLPFDGVETNGAYILQEHFVSSKEREVAYRNGQRFVPRLEKVDLPSFPKHPIPFKQGGTYLLSGGLGGVGIQIAQYLLKHYQARLLLVGRTPLPQKSTWITHLEQEDAISQRLKAYQELLQLGGEVIYETVDICDEKQLLTIVEKAKARWGKNLDGVIHLAGTFHEQLVVEQTQENLAAVLRPKMLGAWALHQLIKDNAESIFLNFSSVNGFFGGTAVGAYAAANSFLDRFSHYQKYKSALQSHCFIWSMWDETGMSQGYQMKNLSRAKGFYAMPSSPAISSMLAGLHHDSSYLFIGLDGSKPNIQRWQPEAQGEQKLTAYFTASSSSSVVKLPDLKLQDRFGTPCTCNLVQLLEMPLTQSGKIDRDKLVQRFTHQEASKNVAPRNEVERQIAQIWQQVLGIPLLSIHDNFFELGGNSLLATQLISRLRDAFSLELSLHRLFASPTVADLAHNLEALKTTSEDGGAFMTDTEEEYEEGYL